MQNENKSKGFRAFVKEKGYYIVLLLCAVAVGTSGYFLLTKDRTAVPETPTESVTASTGVQTAPSQKTADVVATQGNEPTEPTSATRLAVQRPVDGATVTGFAADHTDGTFVTGGSTNAAAIAFFFIYVDNSTDHRKTSRKRKIVRRPKLPDEDLFQVPAETGTALPAYLA